MRPVHEPVPGSPAKPGVVSVAYARHFDAATAIAGCIDQIASGDPPTLLLAFCGGKHDPRIVLQALKDRFGGVPVVGGSAAGAITAVGFGYSGLEIGLMAFTDPAVTPRVAVNGTLLVGERAAGEALGRDVAGMASDNAVVLLFYDSVAESAPLRLHNASPLVSGFEHGLGSRKTVLIGGGMLTDMNLSDGWIFDGEGVRKHAAVALVFPPAIAADTVVLHGCRPVSTFLEITRIEGAVVFELDGEPALPVIERMLGVSLGGDQNLSLLATLGQKHGDPYAPYDENAYVNRLIVTADRGAGSITLFEPDFEVGTRVQIMSRDNSLMLQSVREGVAGANRSVARAPALFHLYIDCAGRASARSGAHIEEAEVVVRTLDQSVPMLGFYSGVEIAPVAEYSRALDWTGVLVSLRSRE